MAVFTQPEQIFEEIKISEERGEVLAIMIPVVVGNQFTVEADLAARRNIETRQQFCERGLAAAVAAREPDRFAGVQSEIDRTKNEVAVFLVAIIRVSYRLEFQCGE